MEFVFSKDKNETDIAEDVVLQVNQKVKRVYWTNDKIDKFFARRSAKEIITDGTTCFMNPCLDLTLVSSYFLSSNNIEHNFVIEEHLPTKEFSFNRLHFALEFQNQNKNYTLNYKRVNEVYLSEGNYAGREDIPCVQIIKIPGENINPYKSIYRNLGYDTLEDLIKDKFKGYSLDSNINKLKQDNYKENYNQYKKRFGKELNLIIKQ